MLFLLFALAMAGNSPEAQEPEESGPEQPSNSDEHCPMLAAIVRSQVLDGPPTITDDQWVASLEHFRGPPPPTQQVQSSSSSSAPPSSVFWSTSQNSEAGNATNPETGLYPCKTKKGKEPHTARSSTIQNKEIFSNAFHQFSPGSAV